MKTKIAKPMKIKALLAVIFLLAASCFSQSFAQTTIKGKVFDAESKDPLQGVTVQLKGTSVSTSTDEKGNFSIALPAGASPVLIISSVGYQSIEFPAKQGKDAIISLKNSATELSDVVVIGYGSTKKRDLTTSISTISAADIMKTPVTSLEQALQGNAAGVVVTNTSAEPGGDISIRVRGGSSIKADNAPLLVVDGFTSDEGLSSLNPDDIKSIEILKDAGATAIYGSRGANGVILVTTKGGRKGKPVVTVESYYGFQQLRKKLPLLTASELAELTNEARVAAGQSPITTRPDTMTTDKDWQDLMFRVAPQINNTISISGGDDRTRYYISANYLTQKGLIVNSDYSRAALRGNLDFNFNKAVSAGIKMNLSYITKNGIQVGDNGSILRANATNPTDKGLLDPSGSFYIDPDTGDPITTPPLANAQETTNQKKNMSVMVGAYFQVKFLKDFTLRSEATINPSYRLENYYFPNTIRGDKVSDAYQRYTQASKWYNTNSLMYSKKINKHNFSVLAGQELTSYFSNNFQARNTDFTTDVFEFYNLASGNGVPTVSSGASEYKLLSFFSRATYGFDSRYLVSLTYRADGSSKFGVNNRWGYFPSASFAWRASNESFIRKLKVFDDLKFRASYGVNGSDRIDAYSSQALYSTRPTAIGGVVGTGYMIDRMANSDLRWEKTAEFNVGTDVSIMKNKISLTVDYYRKKTTDLLLDFALPAASGYTTVAKNIGSVENKGWEFSITSKNIDKRDFTWTTSFNASINKNKVLDLGGPESISAISNSSSNTKFGNVVLIKVGLPLGVFYGYRTDGLFQTQAEIDATTAKLEGSKTMPGFQKFVDTNKDGVLNEDDKVVLGNPQPDWSGGMTNTFSYKNFDLSVFAIFQTGNSIMNTGLTKLLNLNGDNNQLAIARDRWRPADATTGYPGQFSNTIPRAYKSYTAAMSDFYISDGSYLRIKTISLAYNLLKKDIKGLRLPDLRFYVTATNLFTFTKYDSGYDPEVSILGKGSVGAGVDNGSYPTTKMFVFGIKATF
ncbi:MAG TPA: TonB-dependent receptor [Chitinophagaceae bacterium]